LRNDFILRDPSSNFSVTHRLLHNNRSSQPIASNFDSNLVVVLHNSFESLVTNPHLIRLCEGSLRVLHTPNAGGTSVWSEVISCEILTSLFNARLCKTEMELEYFRPSSIVDFSLVLNQEASSTMVSAQEWEQKRCNRVGVSVTRAMKFRGTFEVEDALRLLNKKVKGCIDATSAVCEDCSWDKVVLHVLVEKRYMVEALVQAWEQLDQTMRERNDVIVILTVCAERSNWMFYEKKNDTNTPKKSQTN